MESSAILIRMPHGLPRGGFTFRFFFLIALTLCSVKRVGCINGREMISGGEMEKA